VFRRSYVPKEERPPTPLDEAIERVSEVANELRALETLLEEKFQEYYNAQAVCTHAGMIMELLMTGPMSAAYSMWRQRTDPHGAATEVVPTNGKVHIG
jgi:hypothetical protein